MDPFQQSDQKQSARELLAEHGQSLADEARSILLKVPTARLAGLIVQPDARAAEQLRQLLQLCSADPVSTQVMVGLVLREMVADIVRRGLSGRTDVDTVDARTQQRLPVVVATRSGYRVELVPCGTETELEA